MKKFNKEDYKKVAVHCPTKELAEQVRIISQKEKKFGVKYWKIYKKDYCINIKEDSYCDLDLYKKYNYKIIPAEEFIKIYSEPQIIDNFQIY